MRYGSIQVLRAVAANLVVICHTIGLQSRFYQEFQPWHNLADLLGRLGVDCFFVISGFVVTRAAMREDWRTFVASRVSRIFPIYWLYLVATLIFMVAWQNDSAGSERILASILLLPTAPQIVPVAWSLVFEVYFYAMVAVMLICRTNLFLSYIAWVGFIIVAHIIAPHVFVGNLMALEFIAGGMAALYRGNAVNRALVALPAPQWLQALGDASYSIYLCHFLVIAALGRAFFWVAPGQGLLTAGICFVAANLVGLASYRWVERPMLQAAKLVRQPPSGLTENPKTAI